MGEQEKTLEFGMALTYIVEGLPEKHSIGPLQISKTDFFSRYCHLANVVGEEELRIPGNLIVSISFKNDGIYLYINGSLGLSIIKHVIGEEIYCFVLDVDYYRCIQDDEKTLTNETTTIVCNDRQNFYTMLQYIRLIFEFIRVSDGEGSEVLKPPPEEPITSF